jgi:lysophospholipase L1-like esterase
VKHRLLFWAGIVLLVLVLLIIIELIVIKYNGTVVPAPNIPRQPQVLGSGKPLTYVVLGDSTAVSQGSDYKHGYAIASAKNLANTRQVTFINLAISGATGKSVLETQLSKALARRPDVVLLAVGANDATHFTNGRTIRDSVSKIVTGLRQANCDVRIVVTRSPAMDSVGRFPIGAKQIMGLRTKQVNDAFAPLIKDLDLTHAPIAEETRAAFLADPTLTAEDKFHPNARGYALWIPIINRALDQALAKPPVDCPKS